MDKEYGFPICKNGKIVKGKTVIGDSHSVNVPLVCPRGTKAIGVHHTHPSGSTKLSHQDIQTGIQRRLNYICVRASNKVECTKFVRLDKKT